MGLFTGILGLPLVPLRGTIWIGEQLLRHAEREYYDPDAIREQLEEVATRRACGAISGSEADELEEELVQRLMEHRAQHIQPEGQ